MNKRLIYLISTIPLTVIFALALTSCASQTSSSEQKTVTIAVVETDPINEDGEINKQSIYAGVKLAADQMRGKGGVDLRIELYDDDNDPVRAARIAQQIANSNAVAVIGHSSIETLNASADKFEEAGIPTINITPISEDFTQSYYYHFNIAYTTESEGAYLANYIRKINGQNTATILYTNDSYSLQLAKQFKNTFEGLGGNITIEKSLNGEQSHESIVAQIISANTETSNPGTIFIAADDVTSADLVILMKRKGVSYPIAGGSNLSSAAFNAKIQMQAEERIFRGHYTDGILTTRALIFDSANSYANQFLDDYQLAYPRNTEGQLVQPGDQVVNGYDAAVTLLTIIQNLDANGSELQMQVDRQKVYHALVAMDKETQAVQGIVSSVFFEPSQNATRVARFGIYQNGEIISANIQFEPIAAPNEIRDLKEQVQNGRIITVNGNYVYKTNVVYAGIDLLGIDDIDIKVSTYKMDFYIWFRYRPNEQDEEFKPDDFIFTNAESAVESTLIRDEVNADGTILKTYRISGVFTNEFHFHDYPFDHQSLIVEFRNQSATTSFIQYVVDRVGMRYESDSGLLTNFKNNGAFDSVFGWRETTASVTQDTLPTTSTLGSPQNFDRRVATNFSRINLEVDLQRNSLQYIVKSLLPLLITLILAYITFFLPLGHTERLAVGSTALLTTAFFHLTLADSLPEIGHTVAMEYLFYASYVMSALIVLLETLSSRYEKKIEEAKKKADRAKLQKTRHELDLFGRFIYPAIMLAALAVQYYIYIGVIQLGPSRELKTRNLIDVVIESAGTNTAASPATQDSAPAGDEVILTLSTWRPEDSDQMQALIDEFEAYARVNKGKTITINYVPVMSVNYDSILNLQLSRGEGPDLMYVRPFSTNGNIIRYLLPLNDELPLEQNYDETKLTPWANSESGVYYAMPFVGVVQGVYFNKDMFEKYFLAVPTTWEEFKIVASALTFADENIIPIANALNAREDSEMFMSIAANFLGGPEGRERFMRTDGTGLCYDDGRVVEAFRAIEDLKPYLPDNAAIINSQTSKELFLSQKAAMLFGGSWDLQKISDEADFEWDVFAVPAPFLSRTYVIFQPDIGIGISNATPHPEEAKLFLAWLMTKDAVNLASQKLTGFFPLNSSIEATRTSGPDDTKFLRLVNNYPADIRWMYTEISNKTPSALDIIRNDLFRMMTVSLPPEEAAQNLQAGLGEWYEPAQSCR